MGELVVSVRKLTDVELMREACETTFDGVSHASLASIYKTEHSPVRTQMFWVKLKNVKLFVATHILRHHVGSVPFQLTCRDDRKGGNPGMIAKSDAIIRKLNQASGQIAHCLNDDALDTVEDVVGDIEWLKANADRNTPVNLSLLINAQSLIDMAKLRLCAMAHIETRKVFQKIKEEVFKVDPDLARLLVPKCVYRCGLCGEQRCCGYNKSDKFKAELKDYVSLYTEKQRGIVDTQNL